MRFYRSEINESSMSYIEQVFVSGDTVAVYDFVSARIPIRFRPRMNIDVGMRRTQ